jgi:hypothetical protein
VEPERRLECREDMCNAKPDVCFGPIADITAMFITSSAARHLWLAS